MAHIATRRNLALTLKRALSLSSSSTRYRSTLALVDKSAVPQLLSHYYIKTQTRFKASGSNYSPLNDASPNWSNRPPKETILLDGCDYEHWLIVMEFPEDPKPSEEEMINSYVKTLTAVVGSEEEAKKKIYSVCTTTYTGFGALISEELSYKVKGLPGVLWVLPDSYLDVPNKDYGGDLFIDGKVIHRPQYWYNERQQTRNRPRPRYDRRREAMQVERRESMQRQNWGQGQAHHVQQHPSSMNGQSSTQGGGGDFSVNQGQFNQGSS
ncbi:hypothetical protein K2173_022509 [Erythroxylum novogranatense]|uniref:MORF/ORRM1/DAG-like MORF domain-containing protein n=1 Tax=Erythroxylum novogranatense TaxID=1862640 RepID=A0AAV8THZ8_9ROSI|nr:hypothetical protein K2173_022509 [Erythroxylum novogranatense]